MINNRVEKWSSHYHPIVDCFPIIAEAEAFYSSYSTAIMEPKIQSFLNLLKNNTFDPFIVTLNVNCPQNKLVHVIRLKDGALLLTFTKR